MFDCFPRVFKRLPPGGGGGPKWEITNPETGQTVKTPQRGWAYSKLEDLNTDIENGLIHFNGDSVPCKKRYLKDNIELK